MADHPRPGADVAVVIPCRNEARHIARVLDSILHQTVRPGSVILVDDGSTDGTPEIARQWAGARPGLPVMVIPGPGRGAGAAMNTGIGAAASRVIVRLDGHCDPRPDYIERSIGTLAAAGGVAGVVGGVWEIAPGAPTREARGIAAVLSHPLGSGGAEYRTPPAGAADPIAVDTVPFGTFPRDVWASIGGFDESLIRNQDYDFNHRVRLSGRTVLLDPRIVSRYYARPSFAALARQYFGYGYWKVVMLRKFPRSLRLRQLLPMLLLPSLAVLAAAALAGVPLARWLVAAYAAANAAGALQAASRAGDLTTAPAAWVALAVLQNAWSAGAWMSILRGARGARS